MKNWLMAAALLAAPALLFSQTKTERKLADLERARFAAMVDRDFPKLRELLSDDLRYTHSNAKFETKAEFLTEINDGTLRYQKMAPQQMTVKIFKKTAVITGLVEVSVKQGDRTVDSLLRYTDVWQKRDGRWQMVAWQSARVP